MLELELINQNKKEFDQIIDFLFKPGIVGSNKLSIIDYNLHSKYGNPQIKFKWEDNDNSFELNFYKKHSNDPLWNLEIEKGMFNIIKEIPDITIFIKNVTDVFLFSNTINSLINNYSLNIRGLIGLLNQNIDNISELKGETKIGSVKCVTGNIKINPKTQEIVNIEIEYEPFVYINNLMMEKEYQTKDTANYFSYKVEYDFLKKICSLDFCQKSKKFQSYPSNTFSKIIVLNKRTFLEAENKNYLIDFKKCVIENSLEKICKTLNIDLINLKLKDLEFLKLLEY